jgi:hypothetical protein
MTMKTTMTRKNSDDVDADLHSGFGFENVGVGRYCEIVVGCCL